uniref:Regulatory protein zeste n=1 Tax=Megaselia scalaris TaxID=36166 RepID=T1GAM1_MEGSC
MRCDSKKVLLDKILEHSTILFNSQEFARNNGARQKAWQQIHATALEIGCYPSSKNWTYLRDVVWQNLRKSTLSKLSMKLKGNQVYLDVCDKIIMKILEIQRENNHLRNSKRSRYNSDVGILLDSASLGDSMEVDLNAVKSLCYSPTANTNETFQTESSEIPAQPILRLLPIKDEPLN